MEHESKKNNYKIMIWLTAATFFGKILGMLRDVLISHYYGSTSMTDAFFLAMSVPTIILGVFTASTDSAIIPQYNRIRMTESRKVADRLFSSVINSMLLICAIVCICIFFFPNIFVRLFATGFAEESVMFCERYLQIFAPIGVLHMLYCFFCTYCAIYKENWVRVILAFSTNLIVVSVLFIVHDSDLIVLAFAYLFSKILCAFLPIIKAKKMSYKHEWIIQKNKEFKRFWSLFSPIMGGAFLNEAQNYVDENLASSTVGGISSLNYASKLITIFDSIFVVGISVILLPMLSDLVVRKKHKEYKKITTKVTKYLLVVLIPCGILLFSLSDELISILYGGGKFNQSATTLVATVLRSYAPLIIMTPIQAIFSRFFYALEQNKIPFRLNLICVIMNICLSILLKRYMGVVGISLATTIATLITCIIYIWIIHTRIGWDKCEFNFSILLGIFLLIIFSVGSILGLKKMVNTNLLKILVCALWAGIIFVIGYSFLIKEDMKRLWKFLISSIRGK